MERVDRVRATTPELDTADHHHHTHDPDSPPPPQPHNNLHPFSLNFPTLNIDGSTDDLTANQSRRYRTPPAALSTLGAKASMADRDTASESDGSHANEQWELVDNLSEISNDDHDTASITSNEPDSDDGQLTPDYAETDDEPQEQGDALDDTVVQETQQEQVGHLPPPPSTAASFVQLPQDISQSTSSSLGSSRLRQVRAENDLIDSYMSEDIETPTQSTIRSAVSSIHRRPTAIKTPDMDDKTKRILFVSKRGLTQQEVDLMCSKVASCMSDRDCDSDTNSSHRVVRLPITPAGINPPSATVICGEGSISATIQHCVGASRRAFGSYGLHILDVDGYHSSVFTIGGDGKIDLPKPDIAVFYREEEDLTNTDWMRDACHAVQSINVPVLFIREPVRDHNAYVEQLKPKGSSEHRSIDAVDFLNTDRTNLANTIQDLLSQSKPVESRKQSLLGIRSSKEVKWKKLLTMIAVCLLPILTFLSRPTWNPAVEIPARREALTLSLHQATKSVNVTSDFDIHHLLPDVPAACRTDLDTWNPLYSLGPPPSPSECKMMPHFQKVIPNHMVISLPGRRSFPEPVSTKVLQADGRLLDFNQTKLIDGVYLVTFDLEQACGLVTLNMVTKHPDMNITAQSNFGHCLYKRYEAATTDVSKAVSKDVTVMRDKAKHIGEKLSTELGAGMWATKNVTTQVAHYMSRELLSIGRELQVIGNTAASMLGKAAKASNQTANTFSKDLMVMQKDLVKFTQDLSGSVKTKVEHIKSESKALIHSQLSLSRERIQSFKKALSERKREKQAVKDAAAGKDAPQNQKKASLPNVVETNFEMIQMIRDQVQQRTEYVEAMKRYKETMHAKKRGNEP